MRRARARATLYDTAPIDFLTKTASMSIPVAPRSRPRERAVLVGLCAASSGRHNAERSLEELAGLADAAGAEVVARVIQERARPEPSTFLGSGKVRELAALCAELDVDVVIADNELSPTQLRTLEEKLDRKVVDRTQLILDIFARRARTREGKGQVELAQLKYLLPRLAGRGAALSRLGGGIGTRGPGETKLETDRRRIRDRIQAMARDIDQVRLRRARLRERRHKQLVPTVALVGYTNAGKTTLFNRWTHAQAVASDALFVTLDPLSRQVTLPDGRSFLLSDTVGFIDRLPHELVAAFRATLEEVVEADLVLHIIDASSPNRDQQIQAVRRVLDEVGAGDVPVIDVYNKIDAVTPAERERLAAIAPEAFCISARTGEGLEPLGAMLSGRLLPDTRRLMFAFDPASAADHRRIATLYRRGRVLSHVSDGSRTLIEVDVPRRFVDEVLAPTEEAPAHVE